MKPARTRLITMCVVFGVLTSCTTNGVVPSTETSTAPVVRSTIPQMRASDRMFYWREEAQELHTMAMRREREAELVLRRKPGPATDEFVKQMRLFAHRLQEAAEYAGAQAQEAEHEIPHDMIKQRYSVRR